MHIQHSILILEQIMENLKSSQEKDQSKSQIINESLQNPKQIKETSVKSKQKILNSKSLPNSQNKTIQQKKIVILDKLEISHSTKASYSLNNLSSAIFQSHILPPQFYILIKINNTNKQIQSYHIIKLLQALSPLKKQTNPLLKTQKHVPTFSNNKIIFPIIFRQFKDTFINLQNERIDHKQSHKSLKLAEFYQNLPISYQQSLYNEGLHQKMQTHIKI